MALVKSWHMVKRQSKPGQGQSHHLSKVSQLSNMLVQSIFVLDMEGFLDQSLDRSRYRASEMPQAFKYHIIQGAYRRSTDYDLDYGTECLHLAQKYMHSKVRLIDGPVNLWKVTSNMCTLQYMTSVRCSSSDPNLEDNASRKVVLFKSLEE